MKLNNKLMKYIPKSKQKGVKECYRDSDGYWCIFSDEWENLSGGHVCHGNTIAELLADVREMEKGGYHDRT